MEILTKFPTQEFIMTDQINWDKLTFSLTPTDFMFIAKCLKEGEWSDGEFLPFGEFSISPAACVLNYGQGVFEGMKAYRNINNKIVLFRPMENAKRMEFSAQVFCMPSFPVEKFVTAIKELVRKNERFIPPCGKGSLYIRPCLWGTGAILGVAPAPEYTFCAFTSPVGNYFSDSLQGIKLIVNHDFHRSAPKGTGHTKYIGNYAGTMRTKKQAAENGYKDCIFLDAVHENFVEEAGTANLFCVIDNEILTPKLGCILPGITRKSVLELAQNKLGLKTVENQISIDELLNADEVFMSGTAAVITPVVEICHENNVVIYNQRKPGPITEKFYQLITQIQLGEIEDEFNWVESV